MNTYPNYNFKMFIRKIPSVLSTIQFKFFL